MEIFITLSALITAGVVFFWLFPSGNGPFTSHWLTLPTKEQYIRQNPTTMNAKGEPCCCHCGSDMLLDMGLNHFTDYRRLTLCTKCKNRLWREQL